MNRVRGFTLIELLVVIAVVTIIAAIIFPVFAKVGDKARQTTCVSNLRQLGMACEQYTEDYDERLPSAYDGAMGAGRSGGWMYYSVFLLTGPAPSFDPMRGSLYPYVKSTQVYRCPDDGPAAVTGDSYAINGCVAGAPDAVSFCRAGKALSQIPNPTGMMLLTEEDADPIGSTNDAYLNLNYNDGTGGYDVSSSRHTGGADILFVDGHVKWLDVDRIHPLGLQTGIAPETPGVTNCP